MKQREAVKLKENVNNAKPEPMDHYGIRVIIRRVHLIFLQPTVQSKKCLEQSSKNAQSHVNT